MDLRWQFSWGCCPSSPLGSQTLPSICGGVSSQSEFPSCLPGGTDVTSPHIITGFCAKADSLPYPGDRWLLLLLILSSCACSLGLVAKGFLPSLVADYLMLVTWYMADCGQEVSCCSFRDRYLFVCTFPSSTAA